MSISKRFLSIPLLLIIIILLSLSEGVNIQPSSNVVSEPAIGIGNPAAVYCLEMGYEHKIIEGESGQEGMCILPDGESCQEWDFLNGKCGQSHSFCASQGLDLVTIRDGNNPFSLEYAVCLSPNGKQVGPLMDLMGLESKTAGCGEDFQQIPPTRVDGVTVDYAPNPDTAPPPSFDWRNYAGSNWMTPVKNQGGCGSCWAFSAVGVAEAAHNIGTNDPALDLDLSEQYLVSDCHSVWPFQTCCGGYKVDALEYIRDTGIPDEDCMSYVDGASCSCSGITCSSNCTYRILGDCSDSSCSDRCGDWSSRSVNITSTGYVGTNPTNIKQALVDYGPLAVSVGIGSFYGGSWDGDIYRCSDDGGTNHAVAIVGYDDSGGYWWVRNSWGSGWNVDGHYKVGYGECSIEEYVYYAVAVPEMDLQGNSLSISDGDVTPSLSDHTDFGGVNTMVGTITRTFTIENTGTANLNLTGSTKVTLGGPQAGDFSVISQSSSPVAPGGGTTTFQVEFDPGSSGIREATITIANNDSTENPYNFDIQGTGTGPAPEINLVGNSQSIVDGDTTPSLSDHTDFGSTSVAGGSVTRTFTIGNLGTADLTLTDSPKVTLSGTHVGDFSIILQPTSPVSSGGGTTTFQVKFDPTGIGIRNATIIIANDDSDENPYIFSIQGTGTEPEINLRGNGQSILNGDITPSFTDHTDFGSASLSSGMITRTFTIENTGTADLDLSGLPEVTLSGAHGGDFSITSQPTSPVSSEGGTASFQVEFDPSSSGIRVATISIANNDSDENPYTFDIQGTGIEPEMDILGNGQSIPDRDITPSFSDHTDFGTANVSWGTATRTFTIKNTGTEELLLNGIPKVDLIGADAGDFTIVNQPVSPILSGGGTTTFQVLFNPTDAGIRETTVSITNNDNDENPYTFTIHGTGTITFPDVLPSFWAFDWVEAIAAAGLTSGYPDGTYRPENQVTRAEMATFLLRGMGASAPPVDGSHPFSDITGHWAEIFIEELYDQGITEGYPDGTYRPENQVTRAEMAVFLLKGIGSTPPPLDGSHPFPDIAGHWAEIFIEELFDQAITGGYPDGTYRPETRVTRAEMAVFLVNTFNIPLP